MEQDIKCLIFKQQIRVIIVPPLQAASYFYAVPLNKGGYGGYSLF